jgi:hypothetical protein
VLEPFMAIVAELGRLPEAGEFAGAAAVVEQFGSLKRALALVRRVTDPAGWEAIRQRRTEDMLVYMALARFGKRPALSQLPGGLRADIRAFFGTYAKACRQADELLFRAGDASAIDEACRGSPIGKLLPDDLYVHKSPVDALGPLLRVYEGCGRTYQGEGRTSSRSIAARGRFRTWFIPISRAIRIRPCCVASDYRCGRGSCTATTMPAPTTRRSCIARRLSCRRTTRCTRSSPG